MGCFQSHDVGDVKRQTKVESGNTDPTRKLEVEIGQNVFGNKGADANVIVLFGGCLLNFY